MFRVIDAPTGGALGAVRRYFGLSQADVAPFLGLPQAGVAGVESGGRALSLRAGRQLALLTAGLPDGWHEPGSGQQAAHNSAAAGAAAAAEIDPLDPLDPAALRARQQYCEAAAMRERAQLARLTERATQARRRLAALPGLRAAVGPPPAATTGRAALDHERRRLWLALFENEARTVLARDGATAQTLLALRLGALEFEAAQLRALLAKA